MRVDRNLNIVVPIKTGKDITVHVHSVPIARSIFEQFYLELGKVFSQCFDGVSSAHLALSAPQLAYPALKKIAKSEGSWEGLNGVEFGLINELKRLTNIVCPSEKGWESIPFDVALQRNILDEEDESEIISALVFFSAISRVAPKDLKKTFLEMAGSLRSWELTCLDSTAYMNSLPILKKAETTGKVGKASSLVS